MDMCEVMNEMVNDSLVLPKMVESERGATLSELERRESNPEKMIGVLAKTLLYQGTDTEHPTIGTRESIAKIGREDIVSYIKNFLTSGRALLAVSGDIEPTETIKTIENSLSIPFSEPFPFFENLPIFRSKFTSVKNYPSGQVFLDLGFRTCSYLNKDEIALGGLASILGGGRASRLTKKLRYERGLVYGARCYTSAGYDSGEWGVETSTEKKNLPEVLKIIAEILNEAREGKITEEELEFAKARAIKSSKLNTQTSMSWVRKHAYGELTGPGQYRNFPEFLNAVSKISLEDIHQVAKKYLKNDSWYLTLCGPVTEDEVKFEL